MQCYLGADLESLNAKSAVDKHTKDVFQKGSVCCVPLSKFDSLALMRSMPKIFSREKQKRRRNLHCDISKVILGLMDFTTAKEKSS